MCRIVFVADLHINLHKNTEFELNRLKLLAKQITQENPDIVVLSGDTFDKNKPTLVEQKAFYDFVGDLNTDGLAEVVVTDGNHERVDAGTNVFNYLPSAGFGYVAYGWLADYTNNYKETLPILVCGHQYLDMLEHYNDGSAVLFTHYRCNVQPHIVEEYSSEMLSATFKLVFTGDIHTKMEPASNIMYPGSPYNTTFSASESEHGMYVLDVNGDDIQHKFVPLELPRKVSIKTAATSLPYLFQKISKENLHKIVAVGTIDELQKMPTIPDNVVVTTQLVENISDVGDLDFVHVGNLNCDLRQEVISLMSEKFEMDITEGVKDLLDLTFLEVL